MQYLSIPTESGSNLSAFFHPAETAGAPLLIICHGFCGSPDGGSSPILAEGLLLHGISTLRFSFSPHRCLSQQVDEIRSIVSFSKQELSSRIALLGRSMGAAASLAFASRYGGLAGLCLMASPADLPSTFRDILGEDYCRLENGQPVTVYHEETPVYLTPDFISDFSQYDLLNDIRHLNSIPLLIIHGTADETVPVSHSTQLFSAASEPKQLLLLPGIAHSFSNCPSHFIPQIVTWMSQSVFPSPLTYRKA